MSSHPETAQEDPRTELLQRRERLVAEVQRLRSHLGGLTYEMAIRDHFRIDLLVARAAIMQERDAELGEVERLLSAPNPALGSCPDCGALRSRGAVFCWQCGTTLMRHITSETISHNANETTGQVASETPSGWPGRPSEHDGRPRA